MKALTQHKQKPIVENHTDSIKSIFFNFKMYYILDTYFLIFYLRFHIGCFIVNYC